MHDVELADIQGNILRGYNQPLFRYAYYRVQEPVDGQRFLARLIPAVTTAQPWTTGKPASTLNVAFTCKGLTAMGMPLEVLATMPFEFRQAMRERAPVLVDRVESAPETWEFPWDATGVHFWVGISWEERETRFQWVERQRADLLASCPSARRTPASWSSTIIHAEGAFRLHRHRESGHRRRVPGKRKRRWKMQGNGTWRPAPASSPRLWRRAGEIHPLTVRFFRNGTFMIFRKLEQRVAAFRRFVQVEARSFPGGGERLKAKLVGRWPDGTPVMLSPDRPDPAIATDPARNLDFHYSEDPLGTKCPLGAHVRRANPRDATGFGGMPSNRHRIIRRGTMFGDWLPEDSDADDDGSRGLLFIAFNASIERQFEFVQQQWMNFGNDFLLGNDKDPHNRWQHMIIGGDGNGTPRITSTLQPRGHAGWRLLLHAQPVRSPLRRWPRANLNPGLRDPDMQHSLIDRIGGPRRLAHRIENDLKGIPGGDAIDRALHLMGHDLEGLGEHLKTWAMQQNPEPIFALLRRVKPILVLPKIAIVTKHADCLQVLSYPTIFNVTYTPKFTELCDGGGFFLGWDDTVEYTRDLANMRLVVRREDVDTRIAPFVQRTANAIVDAAPGHLDVVKELGSVVPTRFVGDYIGTPSPEGNVFAPQAAVLSAYLFLPVGDFKDPALVAAKAMRAVLSEQIAARKKDRGRHDDVLERCLVMQDAGLPGMDDASLLNNLFGIVVGAIPTTSAAVARALDELLRRPADLAQAQAAAQAGDTALVTKYVYEAMRFNPLGPGVFRLAAQDFEVAGGTSRATTIPAGRPVLVALQSASFDGDQVPSPHTFDIERPLPEYLHFGFGLHTCFGRYINAVQIPLIVQSVLRKRNLRRAPGEAGKLQVDGPFPSSLTVAFDG